MNWIEASAGSGKTTRLIASVLQALESEEAELREIVAITFTEKAAGELKLRLRLKLEEGRQRPAVERALLQLDEARFQTIHSFCQEMLQEAPVEARVDPVFTVLSPHQARLFFRQALDDWFAEALRQPGPGLARLLRRRFHSHDYTGRRAGLRAQLEKWAWKLVENRDQSLNWSAPPPGWQVHDLWGEWEGLGQPDGPATLKEAARAIDGWARLRQAQTPDEALLAQCLQACKKVPPPGPRARDYHRRFEHWRQALAEWVRHADGDLLFHLVQEIGPVLRAYEERKQRSGQLDFHDLLLRAEEWLRSHRPRRPIRWLLVDECQDIDPLQSRILEHLCRGQECSLTMVGDPKQAIYRFRRGDLAGYLRCRPAEVEQLDWNYRSCPALVDFFNGCFSASFRADAEALQCDYSPQRCFRSDERPGVVAIPLPNQREERALFANEARAQLAPRVAAWIQQSGWQPRDICLIFKDLSNNAAAFLEEFDRCGIPHVVLSPRGFHEREEVAALRNVLEAVEWPEDRLSVYAALHGPLFGLNEPELYAYFQQCGHFDPRLGEGDGAVAEALAFLLELHQQRNQRSLAQTVDEILQRTQFAVALAHRPQGWQLVHNLGRFHQLCCQLEAEGASSFRSLVEQLLRLAEEGEEHEGLVVEDDQEGVRLITAHSAKGLEFPVVILADPLTPRLRGVSQASDPETGLFVCKLGDLEPWDFGPIARREEAILAAESLRLAYVAATRARDVLVVPLLDPASAAVSWLEPLQRGLERVSCFENAVPRRLPAQLDWVPFETGGAGQDVAASRAWEQAQREIRRLAERGPKICPAADFAAEVEVEVQILHQGPHSRAIGREIHRQLAAMPWHDPVSDPRLRAVQTSSLWQRAAASPDARREVPLSCPLSEDHSLWLEGVADLVFQEGDGWVVVDFKTDGDRLEYRRQLAAYREVLHRLFRAPVRAILAQV